MMTGARMIDVSATSVLAIEDGETASADGDAGARTLEARRKTPSVYSSIYFAPTPAFSLASTAKGPREG